VTVVPASWQATQHELAGKTILITGAGDGIGKAVAIACARHGAEVLLLGRTEEKLAACYDYIMLEGGRTPGIIPCDLGQVSHDALCDLREELNASVGKLDGLVHSAGLLGDRKAMTQTSSAIWHQVMQVNVNAAFMLTQTMLPLLNEAPEASVLFTSSGVGRKGRAFWGAYAASKFATEGMMQVLADELGNTSNIRVNSINPGAVNTSMRRTAYPAEPPTSNPDPETLTPTWLYLLSSASIGLNGQALSAQ